MPGIMDPGIMNIDWLYLHAGIIYVYHFFDLCSFYIHVLTVKKSLT